MKTTKQKRIRYSRILPIILLDWILLPFFFNLFNYPILSFLVVALTLGAVMLINSILSKFFKLSQIEKNILTGLLFISSIIESYLIIIFIFRGLNFPL